MTFSFKSILNYNCSISNNAAIGSLYKFPVSLIGKYLGLAREFTPDLDANQESIGDAPIENAEHSISKQMKQEGNRIPTQSENDLQSLIFFSRPTSAVRG
ncbi:hypothetical protein [Microcystis sp. M38BS1]|uniref:hypothetical protein n=1 Tax=Microcystis sp. M38BS1 TaxID=2771188 RepID=UPI0031FC3356